MSGCVVEQRREPGAHDLLVVDDERADHDDASPVAGSVASTAKPPPSAGPYESVPPAIVARSRMPTRPWPATGSPFGRPGAVVPHPQLQRRPRGRRPRRRRPRRARGAARWSAPPGRSGTRRGRCRPAAASTFPCRISRTFAPASRAVSTRSLSCSSPGCGARSASPPTSSRSTPSRRRVSVSASRAVAAIASKRAAGVVRELGRREPRRLALHRDHREMVRDDVVQLAGDAGALLHRGLLADALGHRLLRRVERGDRSPCACAIDSPTSIAVAARSKRPHAREPGVAAVERRHRVDEERQQQRRRDEQSAPDHELADRVEQHAERGERQRRLGLGRGSEVARASCRPRPGTGTTTQPRSGSTARTLKRIAAVLVACVLERELRLGVGSVEARLERRDHGEHEREGDAAVASREQAAAGVNHAPARGDRRSLSRASSMTPLSSAGCASRLARACDLRPHPARVRAPARLTARVAAARHRSRATRTRGRRFYRRRRGHDDRDARADEAVRPDGRGRRPLDRGAAGPRHRLRRPERRRQDDDDAAPARPRERRTAARRSSAAGATRRSTRPLTVVGALLDAGRRASGPLGAQPPALARPEQRHPAAARRRGARARRARGRPPAARAGALARDAAAARRRRGAARRSTDPRSSTSRRSASTPRGSSGCARRLRGLAAEGRTVFVSSHLMSELEGTADHLIVIGRGRLLADVSVDELIASASDGRVEVVTSDATAAMTVLANAGATVISNGRDRLTVKGVAAGRVSELLAAHRVPLEGPGHEPGDARGGVLPAHPRRRRARRRSAPQQAGRPNDPRRSAPSGRSCAPSGERSSRCSRCAC